MVAERKLPFDRAGATSDNNEDFIHVFPLAGKEHVLEGTRCWCHPEPDPNYPEVLIHKLEQ